jgi:hypothetical protein
MSDMTSHARGTRPAAWRVLRAVIIAAGALLAPLFFADMFLTVTSLVRPSFGWWAWTVPAATEGSFIVLYLLDLLLQWAGKPMGWLRAAPYPFAGASLLLNVYASRGSLPGMTGHGVVTVAFFLPLLAGEAAVRSLSRSEDDIVLAAALADARQHAIDLCRDRRGRLWRWQVPVLLRRQVLAGRLPDEVRTEVTVRAGAGRTSGWEAVVRTWVLRELNLPALAAKADSEAVAGIARGTSPGEPGTVPGASPQARPEPRPGARAAPVLRLAASKSRSMSGSELEPYVAAMLEAHGDAAVTQVRVKRDLHVSTDKAREALRLAKRNRSVVQMARR